MPGAFICDFLLQNVLYLEIKPTDLAFKDSQTAPCRDTVSPYWNMEQHSWEWMTCSNLDYFPSEPRWPSVWAQALCSREQRATSVEYCLLKYRCGMNAIALSHLCCPQPLHGTAHCSLPARGWSGISFQQLQFIFALCVSLGDIKWHLSRSHLILPEPSLLWWIIASSVLCRMQETEQQQQLPSQMYCVPISTRHYTVNQNIEHTFPVCWKDDHEPITALYPGTLLIWHNLS